MPQTTDQLRAAILNLPCKPPALTASAEVWAYQYGHRDARHAAAELVSAVPLVAEAPREPVAWRYRFHTDASLAGKPNVRRWVLTDREPKLGTLTTSSDIEVEPLYAAPTASLAPMPEEWLKEAERLIDMLEVQGVTFGACPTVDINKQNAILVKSRAALLSHLRTAPLTLSDEQTREPPVLVLGALEVLKRTDYRIGDRVLVENFLRTMGERGMWVIENPIPALLASVAPQPEQPNTEKPHLADNGRTPVQGLDAEVPSYYCNKCGYVGPVQVGHIQPRTGRECNYMASLTAGVPGTEGGQHE